MKRLRDLFFSNQSCHLMIDFIVAAAGKPSLKH